MESKEHRPQKATMPDPLAMRRDSGYMPIQHYGPIGNMHTAALVAIDGAIDFLCWPEFDSPSVFCRLLDKNKGGCFAINPANDRILNSRQQYLPSSNIIQTTFYHEDGVCRLTDFFPRAKAEKSDVGVQLDGPTSAGGQLRKSIIRRAESVRGQSHVDLLLLPAFNYARDSHTTEILEVPNAHDGQGDEEVVFKSPDLSLVLRYCVEVQGEANPSRPAAFRFEKVKPPSATGEGVRARVTLQEGQRVSFMLETYGHEAINSGPTSPFIDRLQDETKNFWFSWLAQSQYRGRWQELIERSLLTLKLLTYEPTGAVVASPTFGLPEAIGGERNWDYRFSWIRDSSFTIYIFLRLGFRQEAEAYMSFMSDRFCHNRLPDGGLPIMFSIHGSTDLPELELDHLEGYCNSRPVRIGNGAAFHKQLDIYGELMDAVYLYNKYGKPASYNSWLSVRTITDYVCDHWQEKDMSIWEVRGEKMNFVYSKIMCWVAVDRGLRLAEKRCFPCPNRLKWLSTRDMIMEEVMEKGFNHDMGTFIQSYEHDDVLDSAILVAPLVFFIAPNDPRFTGTLDRILLPFDKGGLTAAGMVYRYDTTKTDDGLTGAEGAFSMCTFWLIEALTRAGKYERRYLDEAVDLFENMLGFSNHIGAFSEEIDKSGEQLGNTPQAFSHLALISAAFNLNRTLQGKPAG